MEVNVRQGAKFVDKSLFVMWLGLFPYFDVYMLGWLLPNHTIHIATIGESIFSTL